MSHLLRLSFALCALLWIVPSTVRAQQPFLTDDADVTERGHFHFEFSNEYDRLQRLSLPNVKQNTADFELDYGLWKNIEVGIEAPLITILKTRDASPQRVSGLGDTNLSFKYNFLKEVEGARRPALAVTANVELPTGDAARQLGSGVTDVDFNAIMQKSLDARTKLRLNGGILFAGNTTTGVIGLTTRGKVFTGAGSLVRQFTPKLDLGIEMTGAVTRNFELSRGQLQFQAGGNYTLRRNLTFDFGVVSGRFAASPHAGLQLGISADF